MNIENVVMYVAMAISIAIVGVFLGIIFLLFFNGVTNSKKERIQFVSGIGKTVFQDSICEVDCQKDKIRFVSIDNDKKVLELAVKNIRNVYASIYNKAVLVDRPEPMISTLGSIGREKEKIETKNEFCQIEIWYSNNAGKVDSFTMEDNGDGAGKRLYYKINGMYNVKSEIRNSEQIIKI